MRDNFFGDDEGENIARAHVISVAVANAQNDVAFEKKQEEKERANKKAKKQEQSEQTENKEEAEENLAAETQMGLEGENVREHAAALASLSEDEKGEVYENGGAIVESKKKLDTKQSIIVSAYEHIGKKRGVAYIFVDSINGNKEAKGSHISGLNIIYIRISDIADMTSAAGHELGHWLKDNYSEEYKKLQEYIKTTLNSKEGYSLEYRIKEIQERYAKEAGQNLSEEEALDEITNNALFGIDMGSAEFEKFIKDNLTIYERILEFFKNLIEDLKDFFSTVTDIREVRELKDDVEFIKSTADIVEGIIGKQSEKIEQAQKENTQEGDVKYSLSDNFDKNYDYSKNISKVANMPVVAKLNGREFAKGEVDLITQVSNYFDSIGNIVHSKYGDIILNHRGAKSSIGHGIGRNKAIAFKAVPDVIKKGEIVSYEQNWKNRGYDTAVFAAPVKIGSVSYYEAVVVIVETDKNTYYLHEVALQKKEGTTPFKTGTTKKSGTPGGEVSSIYSLLNSLQNVKENSAKEQFQLSDSDYMQAIEEGDEQEQERLVEEAAKNWGAYSDEDGKPIMFYHGTTSFGFTEFDLEKMGDKRSIFLTSDLKTAQSYSGVDGKRKINERSNVNLDGLTPNELAKKANEVYSNRFTVEFLSKQRVKTAEDDAIKKLRIFQNLIDSYDNFKDIYPGIEDIISIFKINLEQNDIYSLISNINAIVNMSYPNYRSEFVAQKYFKSLNLDYDTLIENIKIKKRADSNNLDESNHFIRYDYYNGGKMIAFYTEDELKKRIMDTLGRGNYSLYAKFNNPLVVDCEGRTWDNVDYLADTYRFEVRKNYIDNSFEIFDRDSYLPKWVNGTRSFSSREEAEESIEKYLSDENHWKKRLNRTRAVSEYAQENGYDGVIFKNIRDNGGRGSKIPGVADYIAVAFDSSQVKSADPITYDDNGEIIPLSERFSNSTDIRYQITDDSSSIKKQIRENADKLNNMPVVADVNTPKSFKDIKTAKEWILNNLKKTGYQVDRQNFGKIIFDKKRINRSIDYLHTDEELTAFAVLPHVLKRGIIIEKTINHKFRGYDTITIAAPVIINGQRGNMAVIVTQTKGNNYRTHRILLPNGGEFFFEKEETEPTPLRGYSKKSELAKTISSVSDNRLSQQTDDVKKQISDRALTPEEEAQRRADIAEAENRRMSRENEKLQQALEYQKKQLRLSKDFRHDSKKTADEAKRLIKKLEVSELTDEQEKAFTEKLEEVYSAIDNAELEGSNNTILGRALEAVKIIKDNIRYTDKHEDIRDRYEAFAEYFKGKTYISEAQAAELRYHFGGVDKANQLVKGLNFVIEHQTSNRTLDNKWGEITELFKEMFEENDLSASDVDEPIILIHAMQNARDIIDGTLYSPFDTAQLRERAESDS